jgi:hypothetical protein
MATFYNDGSFNHSSAILPITGLDGSLLSNYVAENITITFPSDAIQVRNHLNAPAGQVFISGFANGTATLQAATGEALPHNGSKFGFNENVFVISEVGDTRTRGDIYKASVIFAKVYNS